MRNWMRQVNVTIGNRRYREPDFRIDFRIDFDDDPEPDQGEVTIYNLSEDSLNRIQRGANIIVNAGYQGDVGTIMAGTVEQVESKWEKVDKTTKITIGDGTRQWLSTVVNKSYKPGIRSSQIISDLLNMFGLEVGTVQLPQNVVYERGRSVSGPLQSVLRQIVQDAGARMQIVNGSVMIRPPGTGTQTGFLLNSETGLIESPKKIDADDGREWSLFSFLNHRIRAGSLIQVQSMTANGTFRVIKGQHICNESDFYTLMEVGS